MLLKNSSRIFWDHVQGPLGPVPGLSETRPGPSESESSEEHFETRSKALWDHESRALWYRSKVLRFRALWGLFKTSLVWTVSKTGMRPFRTDPGPLDRFTGLMLLRDSSRAFWDHVQSPLGPIPGPSETSPGSSESESSLQHSKTRSRALWDHEYRALWYRSKVLRFRALWGPFETSLGWSLSKTRLRLSRTGTGPFKIGSQTLGSSKTAPGPSETTFKVYQTSQRVSLRPAQVPLRLAQCPLRPFEDLVRPVRALRDQL